MFRWLVGSSLELRVLVVAIAAAFLLFGAMRLQTTPIDVFPEYEPLRVEVQTEAIGLSAEEIEELVTLNLEELLSGVPWVESVRSKSVTGLSSIVLTFEPGTDLRRARQMVQERLGLAIFLPNVAGPPTMLQPLSATSRFMMIGISSDEIEPTELSLLARWKIKPRLVGIQGVANVAIWGQRLRQLQVQIDPARLREARATQGDVISAAGEALWISPLTFLKASTPGTGGWIDGPNQRLGVHHEMPIETPEDMAKVAFAPPNLIESGEEMALGDIAEPTFSHPPLIGDAFVNDGSGLLLVIEKLPGANAVAVTREVEHALAELKQGLPGVEINASIFRLASYVEESVANLGQATIIGLVLVVLVAVAFLLNLRTVFITLVSILLSLFAAVLTLAMTGEILNTMVLAGLALALGVVIDDAIATARRVAYRLRTRSKDASASAIVLEATVELRNVTVCASLIITLTLMPIFVVGGVAGAFFTPLALAYLLAVAASLVVGLTVAPALTLLLLPQSEAVDRFETPLAERIRLAYGSILRRAIKVPKGICAAAAVFAVAGIALWPLLGQSLLPPLKERELLVNWTTPPGTAPEETFRITSRVSRELQSLAGVRNVGAHIGRAISGDQVVSVNSSQIWVSIDPAADYDAVVSSIRSVIDGYPGIDRSLQTYLRDTVDQAVSGVRSPVVVRIYGQRREILVGLAEDVAKTIADIEGLADIRVVGEVEEPQLVVEVDLQRAAALDLTPGEVRRASATVFAGLTVGALFEDQKMIDVVVWGTPESRASLSDLHNVLVARTGQDPVRLGEIAEVRMESVPAVILHDAVSPYVDVVANVVGADLARVNGAIEGRLSGVTFPLEYHAELKGEYLELANARQRVLGAAIVALVGVFLMLQAAFSSWRLAVLGACSMAVAVAGGVVAIFVGGGAVTIGSVVGLLAVLGISARGTILLIGHYRQVEQGEQASSRLDVVLGGAGEWAPTIFAGTAAIIAAVFPIIAFGPIPGLEIVYPTAIAVVGGVAASAISTLFVVPALYLLAAGRPEPEPGLGLAEAR